MNCKNAPELVLRAITDGTYDPAQGCRWPRDVIAAYTELSEKTVSRAVARLETEGRLRVHRPRKRGECNTYFVAAWNPPLRKRTIARLKRTKPVVLRLRESKCPPNRTAGLCRAQNAVAGPDTRALTPRCHAVELPARWSSAREPIRRSWMDQRRRHLHVADLTCIHCTEKDKRIEWLEESVRVYAENQTRLTEEVSGAQAAARATGKALDRVTRELAAQKAYAKSLQTKATNRVVTDEMVEAVIDHWCSHRPKTRREESFPEDGKRRKLIEAALKLMAGADVGPLQAVKEAIDGLHIAPWEAYGKRYMREAQGRTLRNRLEHALGDETRIERCRGIVRRIRQDGADRAWELAQVAEATYWALTELTEEQIRERHREPVEPMVERFTVDGLRVRSDGR